MRTAVPTATALTTRRTELVIRTLRRTVHQEKVAESVVSDAAVVAAAADAEVVAVVDAIARPQGPQALPAPLRS